MPLTGIRRIARIKGEVERDWVSLLNVALVSLRRLIDSYMDMSSWQLVFTA